MTEERFPLEKRLTVSASEYVASVGKELSDYEMKGASWHYGLDGRTYENVPYGAEVVVDIQYIDGSKMSLPRYLEFGTALLPKKNNLRENESKLSVKYNGPYQTLGEALKDFRKQHRGLTRDQFVRKLHTSNTSLHNLERGIPPKDPRNYSEKQEAAQERMRQRILGHLNVDPPEAIEALKSLPMYKINEEN